MIKVKEIKKDIYMIRVIDKNLSDFHGEVYPVIDGASYAAYLVIGENEIALVDLIDDDYFEIMDGAIKEIIGDRKVDHLIINHVEPDHSGSFELFMSKYPDAKVYTSKAGEKAMQNHYFGTHAYKTVGNNDSIELDDNKTLRFMNTPLVHWPDNMWTYLEQYKILFSNDAFGQLITEDIVSDQEIEQDRLLSYAKEYYANIVQPYNQSVINAVSNFVNMKWEVDLICPSHGIIIDKYKSEMINMYNFHANGNTIEKKAVLTYETMWGNSSIIADAIEKKLIQMGYTVKKYHVSKSRVSEIITDAMDAELFIVGCGNYNDSIMPSISSLTERLKACKLSQRKGLVFGSYGWKKTHLPRLVEKLEEANINIIDQPYFIQYVPSEEEIKLLIEKIDKAL